MQANQVIDRCSSTNDLARKLGEAGYPHGTWISARTQDAGRGRLGRSWLGIEGNLFLSIVARVQPAKIWTWVPLASAVGIAEGIRKLHPSLDLRIKWPNDLWISGSKSGGILCEGIGSSQGTFIVIGIGLNCVGSPDRAAVDQDVTSLSEALGHEVRADDVRMEVIQGVQASLEQLILAGPDEIARRYEAFPALLPGTEITWGAQSEHKHGKVLGLGLAGELKVLLETGAEESLYAEDVKVRLSDRRPR